MEYNSIKNDTCEHFFKKMEWRDDKGFNRSGGPSIINFTQDTRSSCSQEIWYRNNVLHRLDGPAVTQIIEKTNGKKYKKLVWLVNGRSIDRRKLPVFKDNQHFNKVLLNPYSVMKCMMFDREYGVFVKNIYDKMQL